MKKGFIVSCLLLASCFFTTKCNATTAIPTETDNPVTPVISSAEPIEEEDVPVYSVLIRADIPNGITDNVSFYLNMECGDDVDTCKYVLLRMNKFQTRLQLAAGDYTITNINVYDENIQVDDISFTIDESCTGKGTEIVIPVGEPTDEEINTEFGDKFGVSPTPYIKPTEEPVETILPATEAPKPKESKSIPMWLKRILSYGFFIGLGVGIYFGYKKCKDLWNQ